MFEVSIKNVLVERGIMNENWRMKITNKEVIGNTDWGKVTVEVYKPKKRKPCIIWVLVINMPRSQIYWDKSSFIDLESL